jgi:tetratricopeptide (TPR) repeat protein
MGRSPDDAVTEAIGREICARRGIKALLLGSVAPLGSRFVITITVINAATGDRLGADQQEAARREDVLRALGTAASHVRGRLGETLASIQRFDGPIQEATTSSIEALKAFTQGDAIRAKEREIEAQPFYERAIELDPDFALAYARLATSTGNLGEDEKSMKYGEEAYRRRSRASERERFYITTRYLATIGDVVGLERTYQMWRETYPRDSTPLTNLASLQFDTGRFEAALETSLAANRLDPSLRFAYGNLCRIYLSLNRLDEAKAIAEKGMSVAPNAGDISSCLLTVAHLRNDREEIQRLLDQSRAKGAATAGPVLVQYANVELARGRVKAAEKARDEVEQLSLQAGLPGTAGRFIAFFAMTETMLEADASAVRHADRVLELTPGQTAPWPTPIVYFEAGQPERAETLHASLARRFPQDQFYQTLWKPMTEASLHLARGNGQGALDALSRASAWERARPGIVKQRGRALLALGRPQEAADLFQRAIEGRFAVEPSPLAPVARIWLARALTKSGQVDRARSEYDRVFEEWKDADPDVPILVEARREYARLTR